MEKQVFIFFLTLLLMISGCASANREFDKIDKALFSGVVVSQVADGLTTASGLKDGGRIHENWAWQYGTDNPTALRLWGVKAAEVGAAYYVATWLEGNWRKGFLAGASVLLISCAANNINKGYQFRIIY